MLITPSRPWSCLRRWYRRRRLHPDADRAALSLDDGFLPQPHISALGIELIDQEAEGLRALLKRTVEGRFPFSDENRMLRGILAKLDPQPAAKPVPPPLAA